MAVSFRFAYGASLKRIISEWDAGAVVRSAETPDQSKTLSDSELRETYGDSEAILSGVPRTLRPRVWPLLAEGITVSSDVGFTTDITRENVDSQLAALSVQVGPHDEQINRSIRHQTQALPQSCAVTTASVVRLCRAYAALDPTSGLVLSLPSLAAAVLQGVNGDEVVAFYIITKLMGGILVPELRNACAGLSRCLRQVALLVEERQRDLHAHLVASGATYAMIAGPWLASLLTYQLPVDLVHRCLDALLVDGVRALVRLTATLLAVSKSELLSRDVRGIADFIHTGYSDALPDADTVLLAVRGSPVTRERLDELASESAGEHPAWLGRFELLEMEGVGEVAAEGVAEGPLANWAVTRIDAIVAARLQGATPTKEAPPANEPTGEESESDGENGDHEVTLGEIVHQAQASSSADAAANVPADAATGKVGGKKKSKGASAAVVGGSTVRPPKGMPWMHRYDDNEAVICQTMNEIMSKADGALLFADYLEDRMLSASAVYLFWACCEFVNSYESKVTETGAPNWLRLSADAADIYYTFLAIGGKEYVPITNESLLDLIASLVSHPPINIFAPLQEYLMADLMDDFLRYMEERQPRRLPAWLSQMNPSSTVRRKAVQSYQREQEQFTTQPEHVPTTERIASLVGSDKRNKRGKGGRHQAELDRVSQELREARERLAQSKRKVENTNQAIREEAAKQLRELTEQFQVQLYGADALPARGASAGRQASNEGAETAVPVARGEAGERPVLPSAETKLRQFAPTPVYYSSELGRWAFVEQQPQLRADGVPVDIESPGARPTGALPSSTSVDRLHIVSYNITAQAFRDDLRLPKVLEQLELQRADIYLLQEVSRDFLKTLRDARWVQLGYYVSDVSGNTFRDNAHGTLILSRFRFEALRLVELRSRDVRFSSAATVLVNGRRLGIASVDLDEGVADDAVRSEQLATVFGGLRAMRCHDIFVGGTFASDERFPHIMRNELAEACSDTYVAHCLSLLKPDDSSTREKGTLEALERRRAQLQAEASTLRRQKELSDTSASRQRAAAAAESAERRVHALCDTATVDPSRNSLASRLGRKDLVRPDRIVMYTPNYWHTIVGAGRFGTREIGSQPGFFPSAHYGLFATVVASTNDPTLPVGASSGADTSASSCTIF